MKTTLDKIIDAVTAEFYTTRDAIYSRCRTRQVSDARHTVIYLAIHYTTMLSGDIAQELDRSLSSVSHAITSIENRLETDQSFRLKMNRIYKRLKIKQQ